VVSGSLPLLVRLGKNFEHGTFCLYIRWLCQHTIIVYKSFTARSKNWHGLLQANNMGRGKVSSKMKNALWYAGAAHSPALITCRSWLRVHLLAINQCTPSWWARSYCKYKSGCLIFIGKLFRWFMYIPKSINLSLARRPGFVSWQVMFYSSSHPDKSRHPPLHLPTFLFSDRTLGIKKRKREYNKLSAPINQLQNSWSFTATPFYAFMALCLGTFDIDSCMFCPFQ